MKTEKVEKVRVGNLVTDVSGPGRRKMFGLDEECYMGNLMDMSTILDHLNSTLDTNQLVALKRFLAEFKPGCANPVHIAFLHTMLCDIMEISIIYNADTLKERLEFERDPLFLYNHKTKKFEIFMLENTPPHSELRYTAMCLSAVMMFYHDMSVSYDHLGCRILGDVDKPIYGTPTFTDEQKRLVNILALYLMLPDLTARHVVIDNGVLVIEDALAALELRYENVRRKDILRQLEQCGRMRTFSLLASIEDMIAKRNCNEWSTVE